MNTPAPALELRNVSKTYGDVKAVRDLSFSVAPGEIFGLLGPNGAGKTTTIRMLLDIIKPDGGQISLLGGPMGEEKKPRIGYLPEERGLYDDMTVIDTLVFLGQLKGLSRSTARERAQRTLRQVELWDARERKIEQLSRGMGQKAQFVAATMHEPDLLIIDEPFSGLDPVNTRLIKELLYGMQERGTTIIMSTHQMHRVEEMCERILLLNEGGRVLYGPLDEIRQRFAANAVAVGLRQDGSGVEEAEETLGRVPGVTRATAQDGGYRLLLERGVAPEEILERLVSMPEVTVERFERVTVSLDDIFVRVVKEQAGDEAADTEEDEKDKQSERKEGRQ